MSSCSVCTTQKLAWETKEVTTMIQTIHTSLPSGKNCGETSSLATIVKVTPEKFAHPHGKELNREKYILLYSAGFFYWFREKNSYDLATNPQPTKIFTILIHKQIDKYYGKHKINTSSFLGATSSILVQNTTPYDNISGNWHICKYTVAVEI